MKTILLRSLNWIGWIYAYIGLLYALYFIYCIVVPAYREENRLSSGGFLCFNVIFLYFFLQGYCNLILTTFISIPSMNVVHSNDYCRYCSKKTLPRSHHCHLCRCCIPIHDHHCFFVGRCIGQHNQIPFLLMLFHLFIAHLIGYYFVCDYLWNELGGFHWLTLLKIFYFNIGYLLGFVESKWQAFICVHHYLVYFDIVFLGNLFNQMFRRVLNGQTAYEEKRMIAGNEQKFCQIISPNKWNFLCPFIRL